ncbi:Arabinose 5-phosphate isomerase KdsD [Salinivirga cyanobacteriivorans]|uniref:Arabinose 5-phosphate isomerase KdsD n=1 Tax=Salinivirga cyanobacteriivorans TaxID=1307839 RepID=A0A0S2I104_9BACT|nr:KpsF/GutQ family sugar-phosphate isomerase [Salinivirga cyanobacteriivorans]ALO15943.1 Arabinose 5-phosphate isomerase KdsD [Salinivirga cyanobacteriivorans]
MNEHKRNYQNILKIAVKSIEHEALAIKNLVNYLDEDFAKVVELIYNSDGRLIVTGIGKSAIIANKIVATLNSTGTPAVFMHAADAIHGDLGIVREHDSVLCISKSGNTPEIKVLVPLIKSRGNTLIGMVSNADSFLGKNADYLLKSTIEKEACPNNLAPTSSTTAQLVLGDALAIALIDYRDFGEEDFARFHPGGALGKKLYMRVSDLYKNNPRPMVSPDTPVEQVILEISEKRLGAAIVVDKNLDVVGIITDGDLRRMMQKKLDIASTKAEDIMSRNPKTIAPEAMAIKAFNMMEDNSITQLAVAAEGKYEGMVHLHDILKEGIV